MSMKEKSYYTPNILEFQTGLEYYIIEDNRWTEMQVFEGIDNFKQVHKIVYCINDAAHLDIKVKHLDEDDLVSLGFEKTNSPGNFSYENDKFIIYFSKKEKEEGKNTLKNVIIKKHNSSLKRLSKKANRLTNVAFQGYVKNKLELQKILEKL